MTHDDVDDVRTIEVATLAQEHLLAVVVEVRTELELPVESTIGLRGRNGRLETPTRKRPRAVLDVVLGVVADTHREELEQLAAVILVVHPLGIGVIVEPEDHGRIPGDLDQQGAKVAQRVLAEHGDLVGHHLGVVELGEARREQVMPEKRHLLFQRSPGVDHAVHPQRLGRIDLARLFHIRIEAEDHVLFEWRGVLWVEQLLDRRLVATRQRCFELVARSAKAGATVEVAHQLDPRELFGLGWAERNSHSVHLPVISATAGAMASLPPWRGPIKRCPLELEES